MREMRYATRQSKLRAKAVAEERVSRLLLFLKRETRIDREIPEIARALPCPSALPS